MLFGNSSRMRRESIEMRLGRDGRYLADQVTCGGRGISALGGGFNAEADRQKGHDARRLMWHRILSRFGQLKGHQMALNETEMQREWRLQGTELPQKLPAEADDVGHQSVGVSITMAGRSATIASSFTPT